MATSSKPVNVMKASLTGDSLPPLSQEFAIEGARLVRRVIVGARIYETFIERCDLPTDLLGLAPPKAWSLAALRGIQPNGDTAASGEVRILDLYSGAGGFSAGLQAAINAAGLRATFAACVDIDPAGLEVFTRNIACRFKIRRNVDALLDYGIRFDGDSARFAYPPELLEPALDDEVGKVDIVIGGPPCQGHSNLNNHTRRTDPRNSLYLTVPAIGVALGARAIIIENVQSVLRDKSRVVDRARSVLESAYHVTEMVLEAERLGVAQQRKRHFLVATKNHSAPLDKLYDCLSYDALSVQDALGDLESASRDNAFDIPADLSSENQGRVEYLFDHELHELPNEERPDCHKEGHTYPSVYGRLHRDRPAQTIPGGFMSPGRGRYVHPNERRGLTPHEGARLQGFPDSFRFERADGVRLGNKDYSKLIGDAVPPPLGYAVGLACLATFD
jgi:DNA (cytosine-5)-methyltransferase 1